MGLGITQASLVSAIADDTGDDVDSDPNPGDVFNVAENDKDRSWRIQAILSLGIVKFTATKRGDLRRVRKIIDKNVAGDDPLAAAAAKAAKELTARQFNQLGTRRF